MYYYLAEKIGTGTREDPYRPNIIGDFVWNPDAVCPYCSTYIVGSDAPSLLNTPVLHLESACDVRNITLEEVQQWFVGGN